MASPVNESYSPMRFTERGECALCYRRVNIYGARCRTLAGDERIGRGVSLVRGRRVRLSTRQAMVPYARAVVSGPKVNVVDDEFGSPSHVVCREGGGPKRMWSLILVCLRHQTNIYGDKNFGGEEMSTLKGPKYYADFLLDTPSSISSSFALRV